MRVGEQCHDPYNSLRASLGMLSFPRPLCRCSLIVNCSSCDFNSLNSSNLFFMNIEREEWKQKTFKRKLSASF